MENDWSFHPGIGLGRLKFDMTPEEVQSLEGIYGKVEFEEKTTPLSEEDQKIWKKILERVTQNIRERLEK